MAVEAAPRIARSPCRACNHISPPADLHRLPACAAARPSPASLLPQGLGPLPAPAHRAEPLDGPGGTVVSPCGCRGHRRRRRSFPLRPSTQGPKWVPRHSVRRP